VTCATIGTWVLTDQLGNAFHDAEMATNVYENICSSQAAGPGITGGYDLAGIAGVCVLYSSRRLLTDDGASMRHRINPLYQ
jgi:hypothetical protein